MATASAAAAAAADTCVLRARIRTWLLCSIRLRLYKATAVYSIVYVRTYSTTYTMYVTKRSSKLVRLPL